MKTRAEPYQSVIRGYETHTVLIWASLSSLASQTAGRKKSLESKSRTCSKDCKQSWSRWIKSTFSLSEGENAAQSSMPKVLLEYLGMELTVPLHHFTLDRTVSYNYKSKAK